MIGMFINTVPLRVPLPGDRTLADCLAAIQDQHAARRSAEQASPLQIQQWSGLPPGQPLFETLLVFEKYPVDPARAGGPGQRAIEFSGGRTHYPLVLLVVPGDAVLVRAIYKRERCDADAVVRLLAALEPLLDEIVADASRPLAALLPERVVSTASPASDSRAASSGTGSQPHAREAGVETMDPPRTETERELARIWMEVLSVPSVGRTEDFFDLGGHSLLAMQLLSRIRETFAMELTIVDLFTMTLTIEELAKLVDGAAVRPA
jgi:acyl carrier protein